MKHVAFSASPRYRDFSAKRDAALERLLIKARARSGDELRRFMLEVQREVTSTYPMLNMENLDPNTTAHLRHLDQQLERSTLVLSGTLASIWAVMRAQVYSLAHAGEQGALHAAGVKSDPVPLTRDDILSAAYRPTSLGAVQDRAHLALNRIRRDIMDAVEMARIQGEPLNKAVDRSLKAFPRPQVIKGPEKALRRIQEARRPTIGDLQENDDYGLSDFMDEAEADAIVEEYTDAFVPSWRDPRVEFENGTTDIPLNDGTGFVTYPWQLEREMTEDFVDQVESGRHEGAKAAGISTFVWVAVIDKHTDDCCIKRDGLTTAEIASNLEGEWAGDDCQAKVTPAHFNCRCRLVPATDDLPEVPESTAPDFEEWLAA